jgi:ankyrin repeat protein
MGVGLTLAEPAVGGHVRRAGCGWMVALMDSGACSTAHEGKARRNCKKEQKRAVDVLVTLDAKVGDRDLRFAVMDAGASDSSGTVGASWGLANELRDGSVVVWWLPARNPGGQVDLPQWHAGFADVFDTDMQRLLSRLLVHKQKLSIHELSYEALVGATNMLCGRRSFTDAQIATIHLQQQLASFSSPADVTELLARGAELAPLDVRTGRTAAEDLILAGDSQRLAQLLRLGLDPNYRRLRDGRPLLHIAIEEPDVGLMRAVSGHAYLQTVRVLLNAGADATALADMDGEGSTAAMSAAMMWDHSHMGDNAESNEFNLAVQLVVRAGCDPWLTEASTGQTVAHIAAATHNFYLLEWLLEKFPPADLFLTDAHGQSILHLAAGHFKHTVTYAKVAMDGIIGSKQFQGWPNDCLQQTKLLTASIRDKATPRLDNGDFVRDPVDGNGLRSTDIAAALVRCSFNSAMVEMVLGQVRNSSELQAGVLLRTTRSGDTALHLAALADGADAVRSLLAVGADPSTRNHDGMTPAQLAAVVGALHALDALEDAGSLESPAAAAAPVDDTATGYEARQPRELLAELSLPIPATTVVQEDSSDWNRAVRIRQANSGWNSVPLDDTDLTTRLNSGCDPRITVVETLTPDAFAEAYRLGRPILVLEPVDEGIEPMDIPAFSRWSHTSLLAHYGDVYVNRASIPYASQFGVPGSKRMTLKQYVSEEMSSLGVSRQQRGVARNYVFDSGVNFALGRDWLNSKEQVATAAKGGAAADFRGFSFVGPDRGNATFSSFQWFLGPANSGSQLHYHLAAVNMLIYGAKQWFLIPPDAARYARKPIAEWVKSDLKTLEKQGVPVLRCVQRAGQALFVPRRWAHAVLNLQDSVGVAQEFSLAHTP